MQKLFDKGSELQIRSAIALDHLESYIYVEADKEAHVKQVWNPRESVYFLVAAIFGDMSC